MDSNKPKRKKVLIITYYWPPCGGIGVLRCLKFAKYLRNFGWEPVIFTAKDAHYPFIDESNIKDIPPGVTVLKQKIWEPYAWYKLLTGKKKDANVNNVFYVSNTKLSVLHKLSVWIRSNFFIPDARARWINPSVNFLVDYLKENPVDAMLTDGPPHSNTRIATLIKRKMKIPWLADFQDPWTQVDYFQLLNLMPWAHRKHLRQEQEAFEAADRITIVSPSWKKDLEEIGANKVSVIPWGFDPDDFANITPEQNEKFSIAHLGIMGHDRNPKIFFEVLDELIKEIPGFIDDLQINLYGQVDHSVLETTKNGEIEKVLQLHGSVERSIALQQTCNSSVLLLLLNQQSNAKGRIPGKLFEYLAARRPILVLGGPDSDVAKIITETERGFTASYEDAKAIEKAIRHFYEGFKSQKLQESMKGKIDQYSSYNLTKKIAGLLDEISD